MKTLTEIPNILGVDSFGGQTYYKVETVPRIEKIRNYFWSIRNTNWEKKLVYKLTDKSFLRGVIGTASVFIIDKFWLNDFAEDKMKGTWIHSSLLFPFVSMSGTDGLLYFVEKFNGIIDENIKLKNQLEKLPSNKNILQLEIAATTNVLLLPKQLHYPLPLVNKAMKRAKVVFLENGPKGKDAKKEFVYQDLILFYLKHVDIIEQKDIYFYSLKKKEGVIEPKKYAYVYKPHRQDKKRFNTHKLPVQYVGLKKVGIEKILNYMYEAGIIEKLHVNFK